ncbi:PREDICTED: nicotinamide N-methyltransferase-like [Branchiostoma belcheri]|uniref:Nicotinamide N-methyltransferase-like n=1 Tax=Branchiostoma belcheri TaxID=7741 RepID=A0A6P5AP98_BRABE|nr:PREDICTED: nicotinamide N-methyltransferase-like [Branchiostoma belcheri]
MGLKRKKISSYDRDTFNAKGYLKRNYRARPDGIPDSPEDWLPWLLKNLKDTFAGGKLSGERLLDVGTGPAIHNLISAARHFPDITCAEFCQENREEVERWIHGEEDAFDWDPFIKYVCGLEGEEDWEARKEALRDAIQHVVFCDVRDKNPLGAFNGGPYDVVSSILALCGAAKDKAEFDAIVSNVGSLVKPGGTLILVCDLGTTHCSDGDRSYRHTPLDAAYILQTVRNSGFTDVQNDTLLFRGTERLKGWKGLIYLTARRCLE